MAMRKSSSTSKEVAVRTESGLPANWEDVLSQSANAAAEAEKSTGASSKISIKGGHFTYQQAVLDQPLRTVVLDFAFVNAFYVGEYDEENPQPPVCFALGKSEEALAPHADAPQKQHEVCATCPQNAWGSGKKRGKACKNQRRLVVLAYTADGITDKDTPAVLVIPPTSLKFWAGYVKSLKGTLKRPPWSVVTDWTIELSGGAYVVVPKLGEVINDPQQLSVIQTLSAGVQDELLRPFQPAKDGAAAPSGGKRRVPVAQVAASQKKAPAKRGGKF